MKQIIPSTEQIIQAYFISHLHCSQAIANALATIISNIFSVFLSRINYWTSTICQINTKCRGFNSEQKKYDLCLDGIYSLVGVGEQ